MTDGTKKNNVNFQLGHDIESSFRDADLAYELLVASTPTFHGMSAVFNGVSAALTVAAATVAPVFVGAALMMQVLTITGMLTSAAERSYLPTRTNEKMYEKSTFFGGSAGKIKQGMKDYAEEAGVEAQPQLLADVDTYRDTIQTIGNANKLHLAAKFAIAAVGVALIAPVGLPAVIGTAVALNVENIAYNLYNACKSRQFGELGNRVKNGLTELRQQATANVYGRPPVSGQI